MGKNDEEKLSDYIDVLKLGISSVHKNIDNLEKESYERN